MAKVTTYPIQYNTATREYLHRPHIQTELVFSDEDPVNPVEHSYQRLHTENTLKYFENMAVNGSSIRRDQPSDGEPPYVGHYCVATNSECLRYIIPFIEWRRKAGYKVDILSFTNGVQSTNADFIHTAIRNLYNEYVEDELEPSCGRRLQSRPPLGTTPPRPQSAPVIR